MYGTTFVQPFCTSGHCGFLVDVSLTSIEKNQSHLIRLKEKTTEEAQLRLRHRLVSILNKVSKVFINNILSICIFVGLVNFEDKDFRIYRLLVKLFLITSMIFVAVLVIICCYFCYYCYYHHHYYYFYGCHYYLYIYLFLFLLLLFIFIKLLLFIYLFIIAILIIIVFITYYFYFFYVLLFLVIFISINFIFIVILLFLLLFLLLLSSRLLISLSLL